MFQGFFDLPSEKVSKGNQLPYNEAVKVGEENTALVIGELERMSVDLYSGRLRCEFAAKEGIGNRVKLHRKAEENSVVNRVRGGPIGMGTAMCCCDADTGRQIILHPRVGKARSELASFTLTTESDRESGFGLLMQHWAMPILVDADGWLVRFGLASMKELVGRGLLKLYKERNTYVRVRLDKVFLGYFYPKQSVLKGLVVSDRAEGVDAVACLLEVLSFEKELNDAGPKQKEKRKHSHR